jgi:hypothetical protein
LEGLCRTWAGSYWGAMAHLCGWRHCSSGTACRFLALTGQPGPGAIAT